MKCVAASAHLPIFFYRREYIQLNLPLHFPYLPGAIEVDLLQPIGIPLDDSINYVKGKEGLPAFELTERTDLKVSASVVSDQDKLFADFSVLMTIKPYEQRGGYLFAIVNPFDTILQFGVSVVDSDNGLQSIDVHYTDYR